MWRSAMPPPPPRRRRWCRRWKRGRPRRRHQAEPAAVAGLVEAVLARFGRQDRANRGKVGTSVPRWEGGGMDGWSVFDGPAEPRASGGGGGGEARRGGAGVCGGGRGRLPPGGGGAGGKGGGGPAGGGGGPPRGPRRGGGGGAT